MANKGFFRLALMGNLSDYTPTLVPNGYITANTTYLALHTTNPTPTSNGTEVSGTGYARIPVRFSDYAAVGYGFGLGTTGSPSFGTASSTMHFFPSGAYAWPQSTTASASYNTSVPYWWGEPHVFTAGGSWGTVSSFVLYTASSGGEIIYWNPITPVTVGSGDTVSVYPYQCEPVNVGGFDYMAGPYLFADFRENDITSPSSTVSRFKVTRVAAWLDDILPTSGCTLGLYSTCPTWSGIQYEGEVQLSGGGYSRQPVEFEAATTTFPATKDSVSSVDFVCSSGSWTVDGFGIWSPEGYPLYFQEFASPASVSDGQTLTIPTFRIRGF